MILKVSFLRTDALHHKNNIISCLRIPRPPTSPTTYSSATEQKYFVRFVLWVVYDKYFYKVVALQKGRNHF